MPTIDPALRDWVVGLRRWFHAHPEPSFEEHKTQQKVLETLESIGIRGRKTAKTGVVADIKGAKPGKTIALRSDMDALRIVEAKTELNSEYRSQNDGVMHACGHDGHMAMLLGAARALQDMRGQLAGNVRLLFQPAEEVPPGGAQPMINEGCLEGVDAVVALHLFSNIPTGLFHFRSGPFMATSRTFEVKMVGKPGHHMYPQGCIDPIAIAARFVATVQQDIKLSLAPGHNYVVGFGSLQSGMQHNQTPAEATVTGTIRAFDRAVSERIVAVMRASLDGLMKTFAKPDIPGLPTCSFEAEPGYPVLANHPLFTAQAARLLRDNSFRVDDNAPVNFGGEDFACYLEKVPGAFLFLGCGNEAKGIDAVNHSDRFDVDEEALGTGIRALVSIAGDFLASSAAYLGD